jgi:hypothetical protein
MTITIGLALTLTLLFVSVYAQKQMLSPRKSAEVTISGKKISVDYGAPSVRGRKIFGGLVPNDQVWRLGANEATHLKTEADLMFGNVSVPRGTYTLFAWPSEKGWKLIINKQTGQWGTQYSQGQDLARIDMKVEQTKAPVEQMVISLAQAGKGGVLKMDWENTSASVNFTVK